jgi:hypothetical protein
VGSPTARRGRPRKKNARENVAREPGAAEIVADAKAMRARSLLLATLRVWEIKRRISE